MSGSGLVRAGKVAIEVGLNETASKDLNPHVPYGPEEVVQAGAAAAAAGAAILHFHARRGDGTQAWTDDDAYRRAMEGLAARCDALTYPSYLDGDLSHVWALAERPPAGAPLLLAPFDVVQHVRRAAWDADRRRFVANHVLDAAGSAARPTYPPQLDEMARRGLVPNVAAFDVGDLRWVVHAAWAGVLEQPVFVKLFLCDEWVRGPFASPAGLDAYLSQIPDELEAEVTIVPYGMRSASACEALLRHALDRGHHIRVGAGDNPRAFPDRTNAELVEWAVELVDRHGLAVATPADVRSRAERARRAVAPVASP